MLTYIAPSLNVWISFLLLGLSVYIHASQNSTAEFNVPWSLTPSLNSSNGTDLYPDAINKIGGPSISAYQSLNIKTKPKPDSVGSQEAPEHATSGLLTRHSSGESRSRAFQSFYKTPFCSWFSSFEWLRLTDFVFFLGKPKKHIFCYYGSSANSRPALGKFWPENIDPFLCTHLIFAFVDITEDGTGLRPNNWNDLGENGRSKGSP